MNFLSKELVSYSMSKKLFVVILFAKWQLK